MHNLNLFQYTFYCLIKANLASTQLIDNTIKKVLHFNHLGSLSDDICDQYVSEIVLFIKRCLMNHVCVAIERKCTCK